MKSACQAIINHLKHKGALTASDAEKLYGVHRLASVIYWLRHKYEIETVIQEGKNRFGNRIRWAEYHYRGERNGG